MTHTTYKRIRKVRRAKERYHSYLPRRRAWKTLEEFLTTDQRMTYSRREVIFVTGSEGGEYAFYKRNLWYLGDKERDENDKFTFLQQPAKYVCLHPPDDMEFPLDDLVLSRLLMMITNEPRFRMYSNFQDVRQMGINKQHELVEEYLWYRAVIDIMFAMVVRFATDNDSFKEEAKRLGWVYKYRPRLLWQIAERYLPWMDEKVVKAQGDDYRKFARTVREDLC